MHAVNSTSLAAFQSNKIQLEFRAQQQNAKKTEHAHNGRGHIETSHGRRRATQIFRQEIIQLLKIKFHSEFNLSINSVSPYRSSGSAEGVAADVLTAARAITEQGSEEPSQTLARVRESVNQAVSSSQEIVNTIEGEAELEIADGLIQRGLDALESDARLMSVSSTSIESTSKQRSTIQIRTQEGDIVKFDLRRIERLSASDIAVQTEFGSASLTEISVSSSSRLVLKVEGDLNEAELEAIRNVFAQAEQLAEEFFAGDLNAALEVVAGLEFDTSQLARVSMKFRSSERISVQQTILQSAPTAPAVESPTSAGTAAAPIGAEPATETVAPPSAAPVAEVDPEKIPAAEEASSPTGLFSGFESLINYLGMIADYLEQTVDQFSDSLQGSASTSIRFEFTESLRLDILRAVMIETAPESKEKENDDAVAGEAIQQLAEDLN
ncbi:MAG: hypothetical protein IIB77_01135 [Proteobacteria bacterium]|nr:hypothetical protein [Pseudomonadota bacterium]